MSGGPLAKLHSEHPWLSSPYEEAEYLSPTYYETLLKTYSFSGSTDLQLLMEALGRLTSSDSSKKVLEIGPGSGRGTQLFLAEIPQFSELVLLDQSSEMLKWCEEMFRDDSRISFLRSDTLDAMEVQLQGSSFDLVFSLWSLSHSIHKHLMQDADREAWIEERLMQFLSDNVSSGGSAYFVHFDSQSEEQSILFRHWSSEFEIFRDTDHQSPSKLILDRVFSRLESAGIGDSLVTHHVGDPIEYRSLEEAMEIFMNFHMEGYFNKSPKLADVLSELRTSLAAFEGGECIRIRPGCFIYEFRRR